MKPNRTQQLPDHLILFDGVCNLCNASIQQVIKYDHRERFYFASLQSGYAERIIPAEKASRMASVIYIEKGHIYRESTAALKVAGKLKFPLKLLYGFIIIPRVLRDPLYRYVARNRYRWFGRRQECMVPSEDLLHRFID